MENKIAHSLKQKGSFLGFVSQNLLATEYNKQIKTKYATSGSVFMKCFLKVMISF